MQVEVERDVVRRRLVITLRGQFQMREAFEAMAIRLRDDNSYGILYDARGLIGQPTREELRLVMSEEPPTPGGGRAPGPVALLVADPVLYSAACTYAAMASSKLKIEVFRHKDEAEAWLTAHTPLPPPPDDHGPGSSQR